MPDIWNVPDPQRSNELIVGGGNAVEMAFLGQGDASSIASEHESGELF
jgi:hypothetical protein